MVKLSEHTPPQLETIEDIVGFRPEPEQSGCHSKQAMFVILRHGDSFTLGSFLELALETLEKTRVRPFS